MLIVNPPEPVLCPVCHESQPCGDTKLALAAHRYGRYVVVRAGAPVRGEWTNIGVILFDTAGRQLSAKIAGMDRAVARGDLGRGCSQDLANYQTGLPDLAAAERRLDSAAHAMSSVQITEPRAALLTHATLIELYERLVACHDDQDRYLPGRAT